MHDGCNPPNLHDLESKLIYNDDSAALSMVNKNYSNRDKTLEAKKIKTGLG